MNDKNSKILYAVCALIVHPLNKDLIYGVSRRDDFAAFGLVGGKVDPGETPEQAIVREVLEETGFQFTIDKNSKVFKRLCEGEQDYITLTFVGTIDFYPVFDWIEMIEGEGVCKWCTKQTLLDGPFGEYNQKLFEDFF